MLTHLTYMHGYILSRIPRAHNTVVHFVEKSIYLLLVNKYVAAGIPQPFDARTLAGCVPSISYIQSSVSQSLLAVSQS